MTDNKDDEHLDTPTNNQSENPPDQINPKNEMEAINTNQETENMEVHHHAHHGGKKNWKSYLWEFLMLFLAVFCGFLAEYQLEHVIEDQREEKYAVSFLEDIKKDTAYLNSDIPFWKDLLSHIDTIRTEIEKPYADRNNLSLYKSMSFMRKYSDFEYHDRTIEQLKNGGNFRLIRKAAVADSIIDYDATIKSILRDQELQSSDIYRTLNYLQDKILNSKYSRVAVYNPKQADSLFKTNPNAFIISTQKENELFEYNNRLQFYYQMTSYRLSSLNRINRRATNLIKLIETEYHLN